jgi:hypothetical protein
MLNWYDQVIHFFGLLRGWPKIVTKQQYSWNYMISKCAASNPAATTACAGFGIDRTVPVTVIQSGLFAVSLGLLPATSL